MTLVSCSVEERHVNPLFEVFDGGDLILSSWRDVEEPRAEMRIFCPAAEDAERAAEALRAAGKILGLELQTEERSVPDEDWKLSYRKHFKTLEISPRLAVRPPWEDFKAAAGQKVITLDPGMAFGTGQHSTTRACLEYVDELAAEGTDRTFLDVGCGSGILAIAASLLGFREAEGFDIDPDAVRIAEENASANGADVRFASGDLSGLAAMPAAGGGRRFDVVVANVLGPVLERYADEVASLVAPGGELVLSGILDEIYPEVAAAYKARGFREASSRLVGEWRTGRFRLVEGV